MKGHKIRLLAILLLFGILLCGCGLQNHVYTETELKKVAEKSLHKKYNEEFIIHNVWSKNQDVFYADCSPKDNAEIVFRADVYKNGKGVEADGYVRAIVSQEAKELLEQDFQANFSNCFTRAIVGGYYKQPLVDNVDTVKLHEYINDYTEQVGINCDIVYEIFIPDIDNSEESIRKEYEFLSRTLVEQVDKKIASNTILDIKVDLFFVEEEMLKEIIKYFGTSTGIKGEFDREMRKYQNVVCIYKDRKIEMNYTEYEEQRSQYKRYEELRKKNK